MDQNPPFFFGGYIYVCMRQIFLKTILAEAKLYAYSIDELFDMFLKFDGKTLVFLDSETVGLEPNTSYVQLTQIAAMAVDGSTMEVVDDLSLKIELDSPLLRVLNEPESAEAKHLASDMARRLKKYKRPDKHPRDILDMTGYHRSNATKVSEKEALQKLEEFLKRFPNVVLVIHNATFDLKAIQARRRYHKMAPLTRFPVIDSLKLSRFFFIPLLTSMEHVPEIQQMLSGMLAKTKYKSYASNLGALAKALKVDITNWHEAKEDVRMLFGVLTKMLEFLKANRGGSIRKQQGVAAKRFRRMP